MAVKLETQIIRTIAMFEKITKVHALDCIVTENCVYFLVNPEKVGIAVGKNGSTIKDVRRVLGKPIKIFGYFDDPEMLIKNMIPVVKNVDINNGSALISVPKEERNSVIGKNGTNIRAMRDILNRHFAIKNIRLR